MGNRSDYVATALQLHARYDVNLALAAAGIEPSDIVTHFREHVVKALQAAFGARPRLACYEGAIVEAWTCLDLSLKPIECPVKVGPASPCAEEQVELPQGEAAGAECRRYFPRWPSQEQGRKRWMAAALALCSLVLLGIAGRALQKEWERQQMAVEHTPATGYHTLPQ